MKYGLSVHQDNNSTFRFKFLSCVFIISSLCIISTSTLANNLTINHSQLEQYIALSNEDVLLNPAGEGVFLSLDLNEHWLIKFDYQNWQDKKQAISPTSLDLDLTSFGGNLSYVHDTWYVSTNIGFSEDDVSYTANQSHADNRQENTQVTALSVVIGNSWLKGSWMFDLSIGAQFADWSIENKIINSKLAQQEGKPPEEISTTNSDSTSVIAGISAARYWELTQEQGILMGVMFSWNYQFSGDRNLEANTPPPPRPPASQQSTASRNISTNPSRITSGDDNYGQIMTYLSYDITNNWSVDVDTAVEIASTHNSLSWAIAVNYAF